MKKAYIIPALLLFFFVPACNQHKYPTAITSFETPTAGIVISPTATPNPAHLNNGKIRTETAAIYLGPMSITVSAGCFYDTTGKIMRQDFTVAGYPAGSSTMSYNAQGLLSGMVNYDGTYEVYEYDAGNRLYRDIMADGTTTTILAFTYDGSNRISRVDETRNSVPVSYRILTRDGSGYVTREDFYTPGGASLGYALYVRNDTLKTITVQDWFLTAHFMDFVFSYDASGFITSWAAYMPMPAMTKFSEMIFTLQAGLFDPAGMHGYYYTDPDLYPLYKVFIDSYGIAQ